MQSSNNTWNFDYLTNLKISKFKNKNIYDYVQDEFLLIFYNIICFKSIFCMIYCCGKTGKSNCKINFFLICIKLVK